jgi:hypothetical protein
MIPLFDLLLHDSVRAHQEELLESARLSRMLMHAGPPSTDRTLRTLWRRFRRRMASGQARWAQQGSTHSSCHNRVSCQRLSSTVIHAFQH